MLLGSGARGTSGDVGDSVFLGRVSNGDSDRF